MDLGRPRRGPGGRRTWALVKGERPRPRRPSPPREPPRLPARQCTTPTVAAADRRRRCHARLSPPRRGSLGSAPGPLPRRRAPRPRRAAPAPGPPTLLSRFPAPGKRPRRAGPLRARGESERRGAGLVEGPPCLCFLLSTGFHPAGRSGGRGRSSSDAGAGRADLREDPLPKARLLGCAPLSTRLCACVPPWVELSLLEPLSVCILRPSASLGACAFVPGSTRVFRGTTSCGSVRVCVCGACPRSRYGRPTLWTRDYVCRGGGVGDVRVRLCPWSTTRGSLGQPEVS